MGTRGLIGFYKKKVTKAIYNHYDSYPSYLGEEIQEYVADASALKMNTDFDGIKFVDEDDEVTPEMIIRLFNIWYGNIDKPISENGCSIIENMYDLLSRSHTDLQFCVDAGMMIDNADFIKDSLFCEWAYLINLDRGVLEVYRGFQYKPAKNRYSLTKDEIAEKKDKLKAQGKGEWYTSNNLTTGKKTKIFHKNHAYYNCDLIAQIPLEDVQSFDMPLFEEMVRRAEDMNDDISCGNVLNPTFDFSMEVARSTTIPMTLKVLGLVSEDEE
jgi:hypothetical protein